MKQFFGLDVPFLDLLGVSSDCWEKGRTRISLQPRPELTNHFGSYHGGVIATLLDIAMASSARSLYPDAQGVVTVDMSLQYLRAGKGALTAEGRVVQGGKTTAFCESQVNDEAGQLVARAIGTFAVRPRDEGEAGPADPILPGPGGSGPDGR